MLESYASNKLRTFVSYARSAWTQKEAEEIWNETLWKLKLTPSELTNLSDAWAHFVVMGNTTKLDEESSKTLHRLGVNKDTA